MRITGGSCKGLKLLSPKDMQTRPMNVRVKQALFNILSARTPGTTVLDLFAGTGALGLEAQSHGACLCYFVEHSPTILPILQRNIEKCRFQRQSKIISRDVFRISSQELAGIQFDLIFFDPPYHYFDNPLRRRSCLKFLANDIVPLTKAEALLVLHYRRGAMAGMPLPRPLMMVDNRQYGSTELMILSNVDN